MLPDLPKAIDAWLTEPKVAPACVGGYVVRAMHGKYPVVVDWFATERGAEGFLNRNWPVVETGTPRGRIRQPFKAKLYVRKGKRRAA